VQYLSVEVQEFGHGRLVGLARVLVLVLVLVLVVMVGHAPDLTCRLRY
jgi:hypothetical protein